MVSGEKMNIDDLKQVNHLWHKVYPFLAAQIMEHYGKETGTVLELGPFSGGISEELARSYPTLKIIIADETPAVVEYLRREISEAELCEKIDVEQTGFSHLNFSDYQFDLIIVRGAFFFLTPHLLREIFRVLKRGGMAFVGGGFGKGTPREVISEIAEESRELNNRLGRKWITRQHLEQMAREAGLKDTDYEVVEEGGLWLVITSHDS